jgi:glyoxylase-like metal-dependent hydrolase (beta-lactamase superfamily II)
MRIETLDLDFQGLPRVIASYLVSGTEGRVLVETGPGSTLSNLLAALGKRGIAPRDIRAVLLTHIHLDHAGAAGWWAEQGVDVYVHPFGAPHLVDPSKLLASARRIYGDRMESLWGDLLPAPQERVRPVEDGETIAVAGLRFTAVETPGHARHHHVYRLGNVAFTGDAAGIRLPGVPWVDLPAPPPEFDRESWQRSIDRLRELRLSTLYPTHFGATDAVAAQLDGLEMWLRETTRFVRSMMAEGLDRDTMVARYDAWLREQAAQAGVESELGRAFDLANPREMSVDGILRYWRKRS